MREPKKSNLTTTEELSFRNKATTLTRLAINSNAKPTREASSSYLVFLDEGHLPVWAGYPRLI